MALPIIDAHHHIWQIKDVPWLNGPIVPRIFGSYEEIRRDYSVEEFIAEAAPCGVRNSVYVQVNVAAGDEVNETAWVQSVANRRGFPHAITAYVDLESPHLTEVLDRHMTFPNLRGVRQQLHWHENPLYRFAAVPDLMDRSSWRRGLAELASRKLIFELQVFPQQLARATKLVRDFPDLQFVLLHAGMIEDRSPEGWTLWKSRMRELTAYTNVAVKLSGLGTFVRRCSLELWEPVIRQTVDLFGPSRCMFGSNFPIEKLWTDYATLVATVKASISAYSVQEQRSILHDTAARIYRI